MSDSNLAAPLVSCDYEMMGKDDASALESGTLNRKQRLQGFVRRQPKRTWIIVGVGVTVAIGLALAVVIAVTVGTAVGVTQSRNSDSDSSSSSSSAASSTAATNTATTADKESFDTWAKTHNKQFTAEEYDLRLNNYRANKEFVRIHNSNPANTYTVALNKFADMTPAEVKAKRNGATRPTQEVEREADDVFEGDPNWKQEKRGDWSFSWVDLGKVAPVEDQGDCGSCWAFSATGALTSALSIATGQPPNQLSEQYLIDCDRAGGNDGCDGGWEIGAMSWVKKRGIPPEGGYAAYSATGPNSCGMSSGACGTPGAMKVTKVLNIKRRDENALLQALQTYGPCTVAIDASSGSFQSYSSGIYNAGDCGKNLDHAPLLVDAGTLNGQDYWLVKNSWGTWWGDQGYIKMARGKNICGIANEAAVPQGAVAC